MAALLVPALCPGQGVRSPRLTCYLRDAACIFPLYIHPRGWDCLGRRFSISRVSCFFFISSPGVFGNTPMHAFYR
jgi:hypothetical protein